MCKLKFVRGVLASIVFLLVFTFVILPLNDVVNGYSFCVSHHAFCADDGSVHVSHSLYGIVDLTAATNKTSYIGGFTIAMALYTDGVILDDIAHVDTAFGRTTPGSSLSKGDLLTHINGIKIEKAADIDDIISITKDKPLDMTFLRGGEKKHTEINPAKEEFSNIYRLGLVVRDYILGIGTVTYVKKDGSFGALGHSVSDSVGGVVPIRGGHVYRCEEVGLNKGSRGKPGEIRVKINSMTTPLGEVYRNSGNGIFGKFNDLEFLQSSEFHKNEYAICSRKHISMGDAQICCTIGGCTEFYDIDIVKTVNQSEFSDKGMVIRVNDKRLLDKTGGIIQGMSGSPIIQNNMLVGAVTHVFVNDPTKGYGLYLDFMYE